ncbi:hypothetical protein LCGC14_1463430 [marine sediment metagenome]|uniref:Uncharacterized protein n=1 Tax=marine sediment metagenome TaxID=412755 RepID=A0A0F9JEY3_9ZZZZ
MRLELAGLVTFRDACEFWDLDEVTEAHQFLDMREAIDDEPR